MRFDFLIPLVAGILVAFLSLVRIINILLVHYRSFIYSFFLGLILASAIVIYLKIGKARWLDIIFILSGLIFAYLFLGASGIYLNHSLPIIFLSGIISICAMILPGISGAFMLVFLGQYEYMISALKNLYLSPLLAYATGALLGILSFSHILSKLLKRYRSKVLSFLVGLMVGGLKAPASRIETIDISTIICFLVGLFLVILIEHTARRKRNGSGTGKVSK